ncbi:hypothetical protein KKZ89_14220 [Enterobacter bugandensis]|jgi:hypothetical protein|uniref:hypothetical protein n=1 Tax=Enterobacter TaxID=547 RepID=UPI000F85EC61|nr:MULTISPECIES: hypothetical protein [Enterobacter]EHN8828098.1 hypothetical protein [Enterobacter bugandensis]EHN8845846.1 hypothetical protein [Enterobacter bugandensis]MBE4806531.1 hypothetical protein [Enterobacter cloacae complex sp. P43RS]MBT1787015.1 hypothetical protein [Enterobacter bugandensis]MCK6703001.1 hypothetical protein [Enterobacter bugandensis]
MSNIHTFYEFSELEPGVKTIDQLLAAIASESVTAYVFGGELVRFVKGLLKMKPVIQLKNCRFAFDNGTRFVEIDGRGNVKEFEPGKVPVWFQSPGEFARGQWLVNHDFADLMTPEFIRAFIERFPDVSKRREHANLLFDLQLNKLAPAQPAAKKTGNVQGKTTKPKVTDLQSFELFSQFYARMKTAVCADQFPTLQILTGHDAVNDAPTSLKGAVRTWFKGITGQLPPNNKRVGAGNAELFCAPIREQLRQVEEIGLETFYHGLSKAIADAGDDALIADFTYSYH